MALFKNIWRIIKTTASIWHENILGYLSLDIICSSKLTDFLELCSRENVYVSEQLMSADKYLSIFSCQMEATVYITVESFWRRDVDQCNNYICRWREIWCPVLLNINFVIFLKVDIICSDKGVDPHTTEGNLRKLISQILFTFNVCFLTVHLQNTSIILSMLLKVL